MRIAYVINQYPKVSHSFIRREIQALERRGITVMRIALRGWNDQLMDTNDVKERERTTYVLQRGALPLIIAFLKLSLLHPLKLFQALSLEIKLARLSERSLSVHLIYLAEACQIFFWVKEQRVDHLHAHFGTNSAEVSMLVNILGGPTFSFTVHGPEEFDKPQAIGLAEKIRRAAFVVAISSYGRSQLYRLVNYRLWPKIRVVHCGLDRTFLDATPNQLPSARRLICVGRLCEQKGQLLLLQAISILTAKGVDVELVLAGDGEMRLEAEDFVHDHQLTSKVRITGWLTSEQVRSELLTARALVLPSFAEGLPVVIMEAMALRRPVISTYIAGIPELVFPGKHGWLIPAGDVDALVKAIEDCLATETEEIDRMGNAARVRVQLRHDADREAAKLRLLFQEQVLVAPPYG